MPTRNVPLADAGRRVEDVTSSRRRRPSPRRATLGRLTRNDGTLVGLVCSNRKHGHCCVEL